MRVLHVSPYSAEAWAYGGIPRVVEALTDGLAARGHEVTVCTTDVADASSRLAGPGRFRPWRTTRASGVQVEVFPNVSNHLAYHHQLFLPVGLRGFLASRASHFDVAHVHACRNFPGVMAAEALCRAGVPYVLEPNGTAPNIERRRLAKQAFDRLWGARVLRDATRVLAVTGAERQQFRALGVPEAIIRDLPNPVEVTPDAPARPRGSFRERLGLGTAPVVMFLGKLTPRKRVDVLERAFATLTTPGARLVIAGNDMGSRAGLEVLASSLGIAERVTFTGLLPGDLRLAALADADVVVYPSEYEIFGLVPCEALLMGTPVIVADDSGCGEILASAPGALTVPVGDPAPLRVAIDTMLSAREVWRARAVEGGTFIRARYGAATVCETLERIYAELV